MTITKPSLNYSNIFLRGGTLLLCNRIIMIECNNNIIGGAMSGVFVRFAFVRNIVGVICIGHKYLCLLFGNGGIGISTSLKCAGNLLLSGAGGN